MDRPKEIGGLSQVLDRKLEEERFAGLAFLRLLADGIVVEVRILDRQVEDRGIRSEPGDREIVDVVTQRPARQQARVMLSSQRLWPRLWSCCVGFIASLYEKQGQNAVKNSRDSHLKCSR